jgi:hypothetical protein
MELYDKPPTWGDRRLDRHNAVLNANAMMTKPITIEER